MAGLDPDNKELRRENKNLAAQVEKCKQSEEILMNRITQLEAKQSEDDVTLCGINRYWRIFDENCRLFAKQFNVDDDDIQLFDKLDDNANSFLVQLSTWDVEELKEKLEKRAQCSQQTIENMNTSLKAFLSRTNRLQTLSTMDVHLNPEDVSNVQKVMKARHKILSLQKNYFVLNLRLQSKHDILNIKETRNDELQNRIDNLKYQNTKMKALTDRLEHNLAELLDKIKESEKQEAEIEKSDSEESSSSKSETLSKMNDKTLELEEKIKEQKKISDSYLTELRELNLRRQEALKQLETLKIDIRHVPESVIVQTEKYKHLQSLFSILYNEATQLRQSWDEIQKQMHLLKSSFNTAQETAERNCLIQQKNIRQELIKLDDTNGQIRRETQRLRMELEQSTAENNLFGSLNAEMKKLMSSMLDYCKQHESDIKRYKRKHEEIEEDIRFSKAMPPVKMKRDQLMQLVRYREYQRKRLKEREISKDRRALSSSKEGRTLPINGREFGEGKSAVCTVQMSQSSSMKPETHPTLKDPREFLHPKETPVPQDLMSSKELSHCRDLSRPEKKIVHSKEVLRSKELLKERYLRDCTKMKMKETPAQKIRDEASTNEELLDDGQKSLKNILRETPNEGIVNLDSDESGHDEPKLCKTEEKQTRETLAEEVGENVTGQDNLNPGSECKDQTEVKKTSPPTKRDLAIRKLKYQLKVIMDEKKDLNLLLGMYKNMNKTDEEKVRLMVSEQKLKYELEEVKKQMRRIEESRGDDRKDLVDVAMARKIKYLLAKRRRLQKKIEEAKDSLLCGEMEITGQVWDELQAQNTRLHQLLREKDEENLMLMTERVKSNQHYNMGKEENEHMTQIINANNEKIEMKSEIIQKMEERELAYRNRLAFLEHELVARRKAVENHKRKAMDNVQAASNLKRQIEKYQTLSRELHQVKNERCAAVESEIRKNSSLLDEVNQLRKKVERLKKYESVDAIEAILSEELREYKNILTCPSCKVNTKDAVLIKCFHVYCMNCIKTRYETRQRKCPECCAPFGANDYHRLFLFN